MQTLIWANTLVGVLVLVFLFTANSEDTENKDRDIIYSFISLFLLSLIITKTVSRKPTALVVG